jgi:hypothetical protein
MVGWLASNELEGMLKEAVEDSFQLYPEFPGTNDGKKKKPPPEAKILHTSQS